MDEHITDHSDSDSGESWIILEHSSQCTEDVPDFPKDPTERLISSHEKDEDTDGISIISDSDHESTILINNIERANIREEVMTTDNHLASHALTSSQITNFDDNLNFDESCRASDEFLMDSNGKLKTYVHRRNKRLSTILNIIMLGSVITAAGVAIGHMWGAKNDCAMHTTPSVNKILSNLYKLQEENAFLRNKLKELTLLKSPQKQQQNTPVKQQRCKKVFEEPLNSKTVNKVTKCLDDKQPKDEKILESHLIEPPFEKEFLNDLEDIKNVYEQNKHWLDNEIDNRIQYEEQQLRFIHKKQKASKHKPPFKENKTFLNENAKSVPTEENLSSRSKPTLLNDSPDIKQQEIHTVTTVTYVDSVKSEHKNVIQKQETKRKLEGENHENVNKRKVKRDIQPILENVESEEEIKKDDRYKCHKCKHNKKQSDKWRKKQARKNRYKQYDFNEKLKDDIYMKQKENNNNWDTVYQTGSLTERPKTEGPENFKEQRNLEKSNIKLKGNDLNNENKSTWYEKRASFRKASRKQLEMELFGENGFNDSEWYFRRMKRREQCRAKSNNGTHKKISKLNMNFKTKY